jgi:hypothetical protein
MPRVTRAALRSNTDAGDSTENTDASRRVFGEITGNTAAQAPEPPALIDLPLKSHSMPPKKGTGKGKGKKAKRVKKVKKAVEAVTDLDPQPEVLEDNRSTSSDAAEEASENLRSKDATKGLTLRQSTF